MNSASHPFSFHRHQSSLRKRPACLFKLLHHPLLFTVLFSQTDKSDPSVLVWLSTCLHFPCPSVCLSYLAVSPICLEVKEEEEVSGKVSVRLAASALIGWVLGGLNGDGHYVGGWWEVWVAASWHLPLWHDVVDGCDEREREREWGERE